MKGVFVTGTGTDVGKTLVAAWLALNWGADYWKPVQTGGVETTDSQSLAHLAPRVRVHPSGVVLKAPLSPHEAARRENVRIDLSALPPPLTDRPLVVEGAGGVLVPLNDTALMIDLIERLALPVVVVARTSLGTINHTLLTLEALRRRRLPILGVVLNGQLNPATRDAIAHYGAVKILAEIQPLIAVTPATLKGIPKPEFTP